MQIVQFLARGKRGKAFDLSRFKIPFKFTRPSKVPVNREKAVAASKSRWFGMLRMVKPDD